MANQSDNEQSVAGEISALAEAQALAHAYAYDAALRTLDASGLVEHYSVKGRMAERIATKAADLILVDGRGTYMADEAARRLRDESAAEGVAPGVANLLAKEVERRLHDEDAAERAKPGVSNSCLQSALICCNRT